MENLLHANLKKKKKGLRISGFAFHWSFSSDVMETMAVNWLNLESGQRKVVVKVRSPRYMAGSSTVHGAESFVLHWL